MLADRQERVYWWSADSEALPETTGWTADGTATVTLHADHVQVETSTDTYTWMRLLNAGDRAGRSRSTDDVAVQFRFRARTLTSSWPGPAVGVRVHDGEREIILAVGNVLAFLDPGSGAVLVESTTALGWERWIRVRLEKRGSAAWVASVDGQEVLEAPYLIAPALAAPEAGRVEIGVLDPAPAIDVDLDAFEVGLNVLPPAQWVVDRAVTFLPVAVQRALNGRWRALLRAVVGTATNAWPALQQLGERRTAGRKGVESYTATGLLDPTTQRDPWTADEPTGLNRVRQRLQLAADSSATINLYRDFENAAYLPDDAELVVRARNLLVRPGWTADGYDHLGPYLFLSDGTSAVWALLMELGPDSYGWILSDGGFLGASSVLGQPAWRVDPRQPHDVEVRIFGDQYAALLVDGQIVNRVAYGELAADTSTRGEIGVGNGCAAVLEFDAVTTATACADMTPRPEFARWALTRLLPTGGCERNDEMAAWLHHLTGARAQVRPTLAGLTERVLGNLALRGTKTGIVLELQRICCSMDCYLVTRESRVAWFVGVSFPTYTPIFVGASGRVLHHWVEFSWGPPGVSLADFVEWVARYLLPLGTGASRYWLALITKITGASSSPSSGVTRYPVTSVKHFTVGDTVHLRDSAAIDYEATTIVAIGASTIDVSTPTGTYGAGDFLRLIVYPTA